MTLLTTPDANPAAVTSRREASCCLSFPWMNLSAQPYDEKTQALTGALLTIGGRMPR